MILQVLGAKGGTREKKQKKEDYTFQCDYMGS